MPAQHPPNGSAPVFITVATHHRERCFASTANQTRLLDVLRAERTIRPFSMLAYVILADHLHLLLRPTPGQDYVKIVASVKANYSRRLREELGVPAPLLIWQKGFWDHLIRDDDDLAHHIDYIHYNRSNMDM